ncbi:MAG TPA: MFS transporter [Gaiellaceae bacterium]|nr:MFS transporter [Gaiellaceae bacterium]
MARRRWAVLAAGTVAQTSQAAAYSGLAVLAPFLRDRYHLSVTQVGVLLGGASVGAVLTLLFWGLLADHIGERTTATIGLLGCGAGFAASAFAPEFTSLVVILAVASAFGASSNSATGRAVTSWFPQAQRGFALGVRQTAIPIGGFAAAVAMPPVADAGGARAALLALAGLSIVAGLVAAAWLVEGPRHAGEPGAAASLVHPLRDRRIWRLSVGSSLLIVTQTTVTGFVVLFLESQHDFSPGGAGAVLAAMNVFGAAGRLLSGRLSDRSGSRLVLIRRLAIGAALATGAASALTGASGWLVVPALVLGGGLSMSWNALAVTAVVEATGARRTGAALGLQQTVLGVAVAAAPVAFAPFVSATSWRAGFAVAAGFPLAAVGVLRSLGR